MRFVLILLLFTYEANLSAQYDSIQHDHQQRYFLQHLPANYNPANPHSLIIAMHGGFGSAFNLENQSQLSASADQEGFIVVYPEGVQSPLGIRTWNAGGCCGYAMNQNIDDVGFIDALIDTLLVRYNIDTNRLYASGMSNGGFMSYRLACELPGRYAAIAPVAATMNTDCTPASGVPVIHFHSYADSNVPYQGGVGNGPSNHYNPPLDSVLNVWAGFNECLALQDTLRNGNDYDHIVWRNCKCNRDVEWYITHDGGHSWPGGKKTTIGDTVSTHISANDLMWDFFQAHPKCTATGLQPLGAPLEWNISPNPTSGHISVDLSQPNGTIRIFNLAGQTLMERTIGTSLDLDLAHLAPGIYLIQLLQNNFSETRVICKQ